MTDCCKNATVMRDLPLTGKKRAGTSLARSSVCDDRAHFASLAQASSQAPKESIVSTIQRLAKRTNPAYRNAIAARQSDETSWLLVRILRHLTPRMSRSDLADLYANLQKMEPDELRSFAEQFGWRP